MRPFYNQTISNLKRYADVDFYDMASQKNLLVLKQDGKLTPKQRQKLERYAYAYRPKITFNQKINHQHYTTLMQPQYRAVSGVGNLRVIIRITLKESVPFLSLITGFSSFTRLWLMATFLMPSKFQVSF
ncbi:hypothetical protein [Ligilactobacillus hayakitensis]|uniref:hypothetical protein n=1 Tax=Ligilactobacillus hayakitensis TaxID=396716 RepID=UPI0004699CEC|nr:hypothetical protein [Ligilactobacillus hayakitensis]